MFVVAPARNATSVMRSTSAAWVAASRERTSARASASMEVRAIRTSDFADSSASRRSTLKSARSARRRPLVAFRWPLSKIGMFADNKACQVPDGANKPAGVTYCGRNEAPTVGTQSRQLSSTTRVCASTRASNSLMSVRASHQASPSVAGVSSAGGPATSTA